MRSPEGSASTSTSNNIINISRSASRKTLIGLIASCITVFAAGVVLLIVGFVKFNSPNPSVPYMWGVTLCRINGTEKWVGMELSTDSACPTVLPDNGQPQQIYIPPGVLVSSVPYSPVIYVTNKVAGTISFSHTVNNETAFSTSARLSSLEVNKFAYCGGMELVVLRDGPLIGEGDYITTTCQNTATGCQYEPGRSLNGYHFSGVTVKLTGIQGGSHLVIDSIKLEASSTSITMPDAYIHYEVGGRGEEQDTGLILLVIGGIMADLMPAALYFLISKPAVPSSA